VRGAFDGAGAKTVIPRKVIGKFSIRIVPDQDPLEIERLVVTYLEEKFKQRNSPNKLKYVLFKALFEKKTMKLLLKSKSLIIKRVFMNHGAKAWVADFNHPHYQAAKNAIVKG
jgi:nonspecific dipeptidase